VAFNHQETLMKFKVEDLRVFAESLLLANGLDTDKSKAVSDILIEGDLLGHTTHGLGLLAPYLAELASGKMSKSGLPDVLSDFPAAMLWDGKRLPGPWLVLRAMDSSVVICSPDSSAVINDESMSSLKCLRRSSIISVR
jgi:L-lactate dehydrogenase